MTVLVADGLEESVGERDGVVETVAEMDGEEVGEEEVVAVEVEDGGKHCQHLCC